MPDLLKTSRPVLFEDETQEEYAYFGGGSSFLFCWRQRAFVLTAKHVVKNVSHDQLRIILHDGSRDFLTLDQAFEPTGDDKDWKDLTLYRVHADAASDRWLPFAFPIDMYLIGKSRTVFTRGQPLYVSGYPNVHRGFRYETSTLAWQRVILPAVYDSEWEPNGFMHELRFTDFLGVASIDGMSGSPVFTDHGGGTLGFAGTLLRGTVESGRGHFADSAILANMLRQVPTVTA